MYKLHLIRKYLLKRRIAWVALVAVMLCTAMVLVVVSVMGGWLATFKESFHGMTGDVVISANSLGGFPEYQEMIDGINKLPNAQAAVPIIRTGALININNLDVSMVQVLGYPPNIGLVNDWPTSLHLNQEDRKKEILAATTQPMVTDADKARLTADLSKLPFALHPNVKYENFVARNGAQARNRAGMIVSSSVVGMRHDKGEDSDDLRYRCYRFPATLTMIPIVGGESISMDSVQTVPFWIVDDSKSRIWQLDNTNVYLAFDEAQRDLRMAATADEPARCSEIEIKAKPGTDLNRLRDQIIEITERIRQERSIPPSYDFTVQTWIEQQGSFIKAVENEVVLTTLLFGIISMVAVLLIFCIFYMIVVEKTKDIGIIKSVGATAGGILSLFLGYGLAIGVIGAAMGFGAAYYFVKYINEIHGWMAKITGRPIFTAETYQFDKIPNQMDTKTVIYVVLVAILSAVLGALLPAMRAASMNPVDALRYE